ncbi:acyl-CoA dehydrogenase family protein [Desulfofundulus salinus]|uniref:Acyl-CoA dehydrogenase n=1 Tax=Desulfofundulus salinus TaxID=2419843 RepID=A0A494WTE8_9FIRM|nr:acyl-CoA dehydrogenase family protein [Desulfofundulus salinum]RKO66659.1 acyl-CoA dehydrogenase [Desulfofundulus salinum]
MVSFQLTDEQTAIRDLARKFTQKEIVPVAAEYDEKAEMPWPVIQKAFEIGLWNLNIPEKYGGQGLDALTQVLIYEELAYGCLGIFGAFGGNALAVTPLLIAGTEEQKEKFLTPFCAKPSLAAFALTEPNAGSDVSNLATTATRKGDEYILNGTKCFITHGGIADLYTIFASTDKTKGTKGISAFLVPGNTPGLYMGKKEDKMGDRASHIGEVIIEEVRVPASNLLGREGEGFKIAMRTLDITRPSIGAAALGVARRAFEEALKYSKERVQFGKPISANQAIQFMLADMATGIECARALVWKAAWHIDQGKPNTMLSAMSKCYASDMAMKVTVDALQIFGGYGYMKDYPMEKLMRDVKITQIYEGTNQIQRMVIASQLLR